MENEREMSIKQLVQEYLEAPMPWIGVYVAAASLVLSLAMAGDVIHGIRQKKLWFPCEYFTMNAASLTVLAVAMKLPLDLTTFMSGYTDAFAKLSSVVFMSTVMGNFLTSFASMNNKESLLNILALGILVITVTVNMGIQLRQLGIVFGYDNLFKLQIFGIASMFFVFLTLSSSVLTVATTKKYMECNYNELHETVCEGRKIEETRKLTRPKLKEVVEKYWVMAETGSPQFVMARFETSATSGAICLVTPILLVIQVNAIWRIHIEEIVTDNDSLYRWSTSGILMIQIIGVAVGIIAPICRWFTAIRINCNNIFTHNYLKEFKLVETYWIQRLVEWKETPLPLPQRIRGVKCKKVIRNVQILTLNICICVQIGIVIAGKLVQLISIIAVLPFFSCFYYCKRMRVDHSTASTNHESSEPENLSPGLDLYVLRLEGESTLPKAILKNICHEFNQVIQKGKSQQPKNLTELLRKSNEGFKGVADFDSSNHVPNCWTMPVVNLTSIAIALPNIESHLVEHLISSVGEGLLYTRLVEESFSSKGDNIENLKRATEVLWGGVELNRTWLDRDLRKPTLEAKTIGQSLQTLVDIAKNAIIEFRRNVNGGSKVLAANSMYKICQTILKNYEGNTNAPTCGNLFELLSIMIADILGACLSNLPRVIIQSCYRSAIEEREKSVNRAAHLLGKTEEILEILEHKQLPFLTGDRAAYIDEWRAYMMQRDPPTIVPSSNNEILASSSGELHISVPE